MTWRVLFPIALGLAAGVANYFVISGITAPYELLCVNADVKAGAELTPELMDKVAVRADKAIFASVVPWAERSAVLRSRLARGLKAREVVLFADIRADYADDIRLGLKSNEVSLSVSVKPSQIAPSLRIGDMVGFKLRAGDGTKLAGPFRLLGFGERPPDALKAFGREEPRLVVVAVPRVEGKMGAEAEAVEAANRLVLPDDRGNGIGGVEHFR